MLPSDTNASSPSLATTIARLSTGHITSGIGRAYVKEISRQLEQDIPVWENKVYLDRPVILREDGPIGIFRIWARDQYTF